MLTIRVHLPAPSRSRRSRLLDHVWRCPGHAPNGPPALDRPWVPVRRVIPVGSSPLFPDLAGFPPVGVPLSLWERPPAQTARPVTRHDAIIGREVVPLTGS